MTFFIGKHRFASPALAGRHITLSNLQAHFDASAANDEKILWQKEKLFIMSEHYVQHLWFSTSILSFIEIV